MSQHLHAKSGQEEMDKAHCRLSLMPLLFVCFVLQGYSTSFDRLLSIRITFTYFSGITQLAGYSQYTATIAKIFLDRSFNLQLVCHHHFIEVEYPREIIQNVIFDLWLCSMVISIHLFSLHSPNLLKFWACRYRTVAYHLHPPPPPPHTHTHTHTHTPPLAIY